jgi:hypothetical protein
LRLGVEQALSGPSDLGQVISTLVDLALPSMQDAMGLGGDRQWTISVYQASGSPAVLRRLLTRRPQQIEPIPPSREWPTGQGHVGTTFARKFELVLVDVIDPSVRAVVQAPPEKVRPGDDQRYRSIAAVPVLLGSSREPWGVTIASSSVPGQFSPADGSEGWEHAEPVRILAGMIALTILGQHILQSNDRKA